MNILEKLLWRWQGKRKLNSNRVELQYTGIRKLGEIANPDDFEILIEQLGKSKQIIRNAAAHAIKTIIDEVDETEGEEIVKVFEKTILDKFNTTSSLPQKLAIIEVMGALNLRFRERVLKNLIKQTQSDLQYAIIQSLKDTFDLEILDDVLDASNTTDLVLRRIALETWYFGVAKVPFKQVLTYVTPRLHYLVRAAYELQTDGEFLRRVLSYSDRRELPHPKAYPDFIIRYITELLGTWEYDPEAFRTLHAIMVPSYFTFETSDEKQDQPFMIL